MIPKRIQIFGDGNHIESEGELFDKIGINKVCGGLKSVNNYELTVILL